MKRNNKALFITHAAIIAALYVVLTYFASMLGLSNGAIQIRFSEALTILPYFTPAAIPGLFIGCIISNLLAGAIVWDVVFGSLATLIGAVFTYLLRKKTKWLAPLPPIAANTIIVPLVLSYAYGVPDGLPYLALTVGIGEVISCGILGMLLLKCLEKHRNHIFGS
ncbi:MAG: QueT transporter family protein [Ruminiclostridium sp.]|nr:QueT transporter family protein [Ruminiclostridium sp.]